MKTAIKIITAILLMISLQSCFVSEKSLYNEEIKGTPPLQK